MLEQFRNADSLAKWSPWLCGFGSENLMDFFICLHCRNHLASEIISFQSGWIMVHPRIEMHAMQNALQKLSTEQWLVVDLKINKGLSNQDVADMLSKSVGAVKHIQHSALVTLFHLLSVECSFVPKGSSGCCAQEHQGIPP